MTTPTEYRQRKNTEARLHGGPYRCPSCISVVDELNDGYYCSHCDYYWDADGEPTTEETK